jgi:tetratricopeptide (TPR) repeat protein
VFAAAMLAASAVAADPCQSGLQALQRRDLAPAEASLRECLRANPGRIEPYLMLASVYQLQGNAEALYQTATEGRKRFPEDKQLLVIAATYGGRLKRFEEVIEFLEPAVRQPPEDPKLASLLQSAHLGLGMELLDAGENEPSAKHLSRAVELAPDDVEAQLNFGRALHNLHRWLEALPVFERVIALQPRLPLAHFHLGLTLQSMAEFDRAIAALDKELGLNRDYPPAFLVRGLSLLAKGEPQRALPDLETAAARMPDSAKAQFARARCLIQLGRAGDAEGVLRQAMQLDPDDPAPVNTLVRLLLQAGRKDEAAPLAAKAAELNRRQRTADPGQIRFQSYRRSNP